MENLHFRVYCQICVVLIEFQLTHHPTGTWTSADVELWTRHASRPTNRIINCKWTSHSWKFEGKCNAMLKGRYMVVDFGHCHVLGVPHSRVGALIEWKIHFVWTRKKKSVYFHILSNVKAFKYCLLKIYTRI